MSLDEVMEHLEKLVHDAGFLGLEREEKAALVAAISILYEVHVREMSENY